MTIPTLQGPAVSDTSSCAGMPERRDLLPCREGAREKMTDVHAIEFETVAQQHGAAPGPSTRRGKAAGSSADEKKTLMVLDPRRQTPSSHAPDE